MNQDWIKSIAVSHDGRWIVSGSSDREVRFWDTKTGVVQLIIKGHTHAGTFSLLHPSSVGHSEADSSSVPVYSVDLSPAGGALATGACDRMVRVCKSSGGSSQLGSWLIIYLFQGGTLLLPDRRRLCAHFTLPFLPPLPFFFD